MYWLILTYDSREDAEKAFNEYSDNGIPVLLFYSDIYRKYAVAAYASDDEHMKIAYNRPIAEESYAGQIRIMELLRTWLLINAKNFVSENIDDIVRQIRRMPDIVFYV